MIKKIEITQHAKYTCYFCGKVRPKRLIHIRYNRLIVEENDYEYDAHVDVLMQSGGIDLYLRLYL